MKRFLMLFLSGAMVFFILFHLVSNMERVLVEDYKILIGSQEITVVLNFNNNSFDTIIFYNSSILGIRNVNNIVIIKYGKFVVNTVEITFEDDTIAQKFYNEILEKYMGENDER